MQKGVALLHAPDRAVHGAPIARSADCLFLCQAPRREVIKRFNGAKKKEAVFSDSFLFFVEVIRIALQASTSCLGLPGRGLRWRATSCRPSRAAARRSGPSILITSPKHKKNGLDQ